MQKYHFWPLSLKIESPVMKRKPVDRKEDIFEEGLKIESP
jgi:hypothetical protein